MKHHGFFGFKIVIKREEDGADFTNFGDVRQKLVFALATGLGVTADQWVCHNSCFGKL